MSAKGRESEGEKERERGGEREPENQGAVLLAGLNLHLFRHKPQRRLLPGLTLLSSRQYCAYSLGARAVPTVLWIHLILTLAVSLTLSHCSDHPHHP